MSSANLDEEDYFKIWHHLLRENINYLLQCGKIGLEYLTAQDIVPLQSGQHWEPGTCDKHLYEYEFVLKVPFAGKKFDWVLLFDPGNLTFAPAFDFKTDCQFTPNIDEVLQNVPSLAKWNVMNAESLTSVLRDFHEWLNKINVAKLATNFELASAHFEYNNLIQVIQAEKVEVFVDLNIVHFLIGIDIDTAIDLPNFPNSSGKCQCVQTGDITANLLLSFNIVESKRSTSSIRLSPRLNDIVMDEFSFLSKYSNANDLLDYVITVSSRLHEIFVANCERNNFRKDFITCLISSKRYSLVEFDAISFNMGTVLCELNGRLYLVAIKLSDTAPLTKPVVTFRSIGRGNYKVNTNLNTIENYPYNPKWKVEAMIQSIFGELESAFAKCDTKNVKKNDE